MPTAMALTAALSPMVEAGIIRLDEVGVATSGLMKEDSGRPKTAAETKVLDKVAIAKKDGLKKLIPIAAIAAIAAKLFIF